MLITSVILVLLISVEQVGPNENICYLLSDIVIAVDTTSSQSSSDFDIVKSEVLKVAENFTIGQTYTRLALVSIANTASVVVNLDAVKTLEDFKTAVKKLSYSSETADLSEGIRVSNDQVFYKARPKALRILILVKDRRAAGSTVYDKNVLSRITSEAKRVTNVVTTINVVGIGGLWSTAELKAIYGPEYFLFKGKEKALASIKKLKDKSCEPRCPMRGKTTPVQYGICYGGKKHLRLFARVLTTNDKDGVQICRKEVVRHIGDCQDENIRCSNLLPERTLGTCDPTTNKNEVHKTTTYFAEIDQACRKETQSTTVECGTENENKCEQKADIIFVLEKTSFVGGNFKSMIDVTIEIINALTIGWSHVAVGIISFSNHAYSDIHLGQFQTKAELLKGISEISLATGAWPYTNKGIKEAIRMFQVNGRPGATQHLFIMTISMSNNPLLSMAEIKILKQKQVQVYSIGLKGAYLTELEAWAAPQIHQNMFFLNSFDQLKPWSQNFSKSLCIKLAPTSVELCNNKVFLQSVSNCMGKVRYVISTRYAFDQGKCVRIYDQRESYDCSQKCISPIDGNEYLSGDKWSSVCYEFRCDKGTPTVISSKCMASDGSCKDINSPPFDCLDEDKKVAKNCQCIVTEFDATLAIDRH